jgi:hypothetical protein
MVLADCSPTNLDGCVTKGDICICSNTKEIGQCTNRDEYPCNNLYCRCINPDSASSQKTKNPFKKQKDLRLIDVLSQKQ